MQGMIKFVALLTVLVTGGIFQPAAAEQSFADWVAELRVEALADGISANTFDSAFDGVEPIKRVVKLDRKQPEKVLTLDEYVGKVINNYRIQQGKKKLAEQRELLDAVHAKYGIQPRFLVAFWGLETSYGRLTGGHSVIAAIATLAYDGRRAAFFRSQLLDALHILEDGHIEPENMIGSWAGAMGQAQFMPSTFRAYAVDGDGDGKIDLWKSKADVFHSAGNYLSQVGWDGDLTWGREVKLPEGFDVSQIGLKIKKPLAEWSRLGVTRVTGKALPQRDIQASLVKPDEGKWGRVFLVYDNYRAIMKWNRAHKYAIAVGTLSDKIAR